MNRPEEGDALLIVGAGRLGIALGTALQAAGAVRSLTFAGRTAAAPDHPLFAGPRPRAAYASLSRLPSPQPTGVVLAVPDDALAEAAERLAAGVVPEGVPVLHTAGSRGADALGPLVRRGHPVGSVHPLAAVPGAADGALRLADVWWGVEGEAAAEALALRIVKACGGRVLRVSPGGKPLYHAAAVLAANYVVVLLSLAEGLMSRAGVEEAHARAALASLAAGAVANVAEHGPAAALTGPVARGDAETVRLHLARLSGDEHEIYSRLGREALRLASAAGLDEAAAARVQRVLGEGE